MQIKQTYEAIAKKDYANVNWKKKKGFSASI